MPSLPEFRNEPLTDFSKPENRTAMEAAIEKVASWTNREALERLRASKRA